MFDFWRDYSTAWSGNLRKPGAENTQNVRNSANGQGIRGHRTLSAEQALRAFSYCLLPNAYCLMPRQSGNTASKTAPFSLRADSVP